MKTLLKALLALMLLTSLVGCGDGGDSTDSEAPAPVTTEEVSGDS